MLRSKINHNAFLLVIPVLVLLATIFSFARGDIKIIKTENIETYISSDYNNFKIALIFDFEKKYFFKNTMYIYANKNNFKIKSNRK